MSRHTLIVTALGLASLVGCSDGTTTTKSGTPAPSSTSSTEPAPSGSAPATSSLGPSCTAYLACCDAVAAKNPQLGASCDSTRKSLTDAQGKSASIDAYESACKSGLDGFKTAGYCK